MSTYDPEIYKNNLTVNVSGTLFPVNNQVLMSRSGYFRRMLSSNFREGTANQITIQELTPDYFRTLLDIIYRRPYVPSLGAMWLIHYFDIKDEDLNAIHRKIEISPEGFSDYLEYLSKIYPTELDQDVLDIISSKVRYNTDLSKVDPQMVAELRKSPEFRYTGSKYDKVIDDLYQEALSKMDQPLKYYQLILPPKSGPLFESSKHSAPALVTAHSSAEAFLKWNKLLKEPDIINSIDNYFIKPDKRRELLSIYLDVVDPDKTYNFRMIEEAAKRPIQPPTILGMSRYPDIPRSPIMRDYLLLE